MRNICSESQLHPIAQVLHLATVGEANCLQTPPLGGRTPFGLLLEYPALILNDRRLDFSHSDPAGRAHGQSQLVDLKSDRPSTRALQPIDDDLLGDRHAALVPRRDLRGDECDCGRRFKCEQQLLARAGSRVR